MSCVDNVYSPPNIRAFAVSLLLASTIGCGGGTDSTSAGGANAGPLRVRRSCSSLCSAERKEVVDAFVALKKKTNLTWSYHSYCENPKYGPMPPYTKNAYDFFVELHIAAFTMMSATGEAPT